MYKPIIKEEVSSGKCLPLKTLSFVPESANNSRNISSRSNKTKR